MQSLQTAYTNRYMISNFSLSEDIIEQFSIFDVTEL